MNCLTCWYMSLRHFKDMLGRSIQLNESLSLFLFLYFVDKICAMQYLYYLKHDSHALSQANIIGKEIKGTCLAVKTPKCFFSLTSLFVQIFRVTLGIKASIHCMHLSTS